jgi:hypothetical protein
MLTGWYAGAAAEIRSRGTLLLVLREDGTVADGRWVGVAANGAIVTGAAALARTREGAQRAIAAFAARPPNPLTAQ